MPPARATILVVDDEPSQRDLLTGFLASLRFRALEAGSAEQALDMIRNNRFTGSRKVVDVSGDGVETDPWFKKAFTLPDARQMAKAQGVTFNGLAILTDNSRLDQYYRKEVISGPGAFVVKAVNFDAFAVAIRNKMLREMSPVITWNRMKDQVRFVAKTQ